MNPTRRITEADRHVADVLAQRFQGRDSLDWLEVALTAMNALFEYEEMLNQQFMADHRA